jgi:hypothetical protein
MSTEKLNVVLAEFQTLRNEVNLKLKMVYQIYVIYFTALGLFYSYTVANKIFDLVLAVPLVALALFFRLIYDQLVLRKIDDYIKSQISEQQIPSIIGENQPPLMQWLHYYRSYGPRKLYKGSYFMIFVLISVVPAIWRNLSVIQSLHAGAPCYTALPSWTYCPILFINLLIGLCMALMIVLCKY